MSNSTMYLAATLNEHENIVELFKNMTLTQIKDAMNIGLYYLNINVNPSQFPILCTTINDLFSPMVSAMRSFDYCVVKCDDAINQKDIKLIATIILSHAYALFNLYMSYDYWPKNAVSEYLGYFEKIVME